MFEGYYAAHVVRDRDRERAQDLALNRMERVPSVGEQRAVLSADWSGWSWGRARAVLVRR